MKKRTVQALNQINQSFYEKAGEEFGRTRMGYWRGWERWWQKRLEKGLKINQILDLGCGNGRLANFLDEKDIAAEYTGVDSSTILLKQAKGRKLENLKVRFIKVDLLKDNKWFSDVNNYDLIAVFGLMHHIPGFKQRIDLLKLITGKLSPGGMLAISFWQYGRDVRFTKKLVEWQSLTELFGISVEIDDLEPGDYLLSWGKTKNYLRYCHMVDDTEVKRLINKVRLRLIDDYQADGRSGELNRYLIWQKPEQ